MGTARLDLANIDPYADTNSIFNIMTPQGQLKGICLIKVLVVARHQCKLLLCLTKSILMTVSALATLLIKIDCSIE
jgi:hypothetical protein